MVRPLLVALAAALLIAATACPRADERAPAPKPVDAVTSVPTSVQEAERIEARPGDEPVEVQQSRVKDAISALEKLGGATDADPPESRPGAETFRSAELDKLGELVAGACRGADPPCREILEAIADANLPFDEVRGIYGRFLDELKPRAHIAASTLGGSLLTREHGKTRDIAFRIAVGSGAARRGQPDDDGRRATTIPLRPRVGEPLWVVFEWMAPCNDIQMQMKGPDQHGRIDLVPRDPCPPAPEDPTRLVPRAIRAVWATRLDALPEVGLTVWLPDADRPLVAVTPREVEGAPKPAP